jgi:hypothetical protein
MEKINTFMGILLKFVVAVCIAVATLFYCMNAGNDRYKYVKDISLWSFDSKTGLTRITPQKD